MKKVLIITYYWPPSGGSGVQRWLKFVKYLRDFDIEPIVFTVDDPEYAIIDESLASDIPEGVEVIKHPIWEPYKLASFFSKKKKNKEQVGFLTKKKSFFGKVIAYIRANFFIPDARMFWVKPSAKFLKSYIKKNDIEVVISSGPPHSLHMIALKLKKELGITWISDFRDPWTEIDYMHQLPLSARSKKKHARLEKEVLENSDAVIVVGETMRQAYLPTNSNTYVIANGYDVDLLKDDVTLDDHFSITHIGLMNEDRNPHILWKVLSRMANENDEFRKSLKINLIGKVSDEVEKELTERSLLSNAEFIDYLPHTEVIAYQRKSQVLLLALNNVPSAKGIITGKIFEYLMANRPVIAIAPEDGDLAKILQETNAGKVVGFENENDLYELVQRLYNEYISGNLYLKSTGVEKYHRRNLTEELAVIINKTIRK